MNSQTPNFNTHCGWCGLKKIFGKRFCYPFHTFFRTIGNRIRMLPKIRRFGFRYLWDEQYRNFCRNQINSRRSRIKYGSEYYRKKRQIKLNLLKKKVVCFFCTQRLYYSSSTIDHITPVSKGGRNEFSNFRLIHEECRRKRDSALARNGML